MSIFVFRCLCFFSLLSCSTGLFAESVVVRKVRIVVEGQTQPSAVRDSLVSLVEGQTVDSAALPDTLRELEDRLLRSGDFSSVSVLAVPSTADANSVNVVIEVQDAWGWHFGGGPLWGSAEWQNVAGSSKDVGVSLGWNLQKANYQDRHPGWAGWSWSGELGHSALLVRDGVGSLRSVDQWGVGGSAARQWGWGWETGLRAQSALVYDGAPEPQLDQQILARLTWDRSPAGFSPSRGWRADAQMTSFLPSGLLRATADVRTWFALGLPQVKLAVSWTGTFEQGDQPQQSRYLWCASGLDAVRKAFSPSDLATSGQVISAELRAQVLSAPLFDFTRLAVEPALLADWSKPQLWAVGAGLRLFIEAPINVPLRFEYAVDQSGSGTFFFSVSSPDSRAVQE